MENVKKINNGILYVVATPIGNMQDLSPRAKSVLQAVEYIAAEDTRHSRLLLTHFGIQTPLLSLHAHNEKQACHAVVQFLQSGKNIALISDAGTPLISDPGAYLVKSAHEYGISVLPIPGPCALVTALSASGLPADNFVFEGFLPAKSQARQQQLEKLRQEMRTIIFYEAPHRIIECITAMIAVFGENRIAVLAKELSKVFETIYRNDLQSILNWLTQEPARQKGEFVIILQGAPQLDSQLIDNETKRIFTLLRRELPLNQAVKLCSHITGISKNALYDFGLQQQFPENSESTENT
jgi:16S rRNA (cytidine1402-2'-O)-methyltransferase